MRCRRTRRSGTPTPSRPRWRIPTMTRTAFSASSTPSGTTCRGRSRRARSPGGAAAMPGGVPARSCRLASSNLAPADPTATDIAADVAVRPDGAAALYDAYKRDDGALRVALDPPTGRGGRDGSSVTHEVHVFEPSGPRWPKARKRRSWRVRKSAGRGCGTTRCNAGHWLHVTTRGACGRARAGDGSPVRQSDQLSESLLGVGLKVLLLTPRARNPSAPPRVGTSGIEAGRQRRRTRPRRRARIAGGAGARTVAPRRASRPVSQAGRVICPLRRPAALRPPRRARCPPRHTGHVHRRPRPHPDPPRPRPRVRATEPSPVTARARSEALSASVGSRPAHHVRVEGHVRYQVGADVHATSPCAANSVVSEPYRPAPREPGVHVGGGRHAGEGGGGGAVGTFRLVVSCRQAEAERGSGGSPMGEQRGVGGERCASSSAPDSPSPSGDILTPRPAGRAPRLDLPCIAQLDKPTCDVPCLNRSADKRRPNVARSDRPVRVRARLAP